MCTQYFPFCPSPCGHTFFVKEISGLRKRRCGKGRDFGVAAPSLLLLLAPLKARGVIGGVAKARGGLKLRFLPLPANSVGRAFLSPRNPPSKQPCRPQERRIMGERAVMLTRSFTSSCFLFLVLLSPAERGESKGHTNGSRQASGASPSHFPLVLDRKNYLVAHQNTLETSFVLRPQ